MTLWLGLYEEGSLEARALRHCSTCGVSLGRLSLVVLVAMGGTCAACDPEGPEARERFLAECEEEEEVHTGGSCGGVRETPTAPTMEKALDLFP